VNQEDAKLLLSVHRASDPHSDDELLVLALGLAEQDAELRDWWEGEQARIAALDAKFRELTPPPGLRSRILASCQPAAPAPRRSRRRLVLGVAALLLLSLLGGALWLNRPFTSGGTSLAAYRKDMTTFLDRFFLLDYESETVSDVTAWLERTQGIKDFVIPKSLGGNPSLGCEVISWHGRKAYLVCFDVQGELVHLFLLPGGAELEARPGEAAPVPVDSKWSHATWTEGNDLYFCCTLGDEDLLQRALDRPLRLPEANPKPTATTRTNLKT